MSARKDLVQLRATALEKAQWKRAARRAGLTLSDWIRLHLGIAARAT